MTEDCWFETKPCGCAIRAVCADVAPRIVGEAALEGPQWVLGPLSEVPSRLKRCTCEPVGAEK